MRRAWAVRAARDVRLGVKNLLLHKLRSLLTMLGLVLAFYLLPAKAWAVAQADGTWTILGQSRKGGALFREEFDRAAKAEKGSDL